MAAATAVDTLAHEECAASCTLLLCEPLYIWPAQWKVPLTLGPTPFLSPQLIFSVSALIDTLKCVFPA